MLRSFYEAVLPRSGHYALFLLDTKRHVWASSIDQLVAATEQRHAKQGVYFAVESFREPTTRAQANVLALRALRLDIDAGAKKYAKNPAGAYETQREATAAAVAFCRTVQMAPSYIVSSGEGLHVYFALDEDLEPAQWVPLAERLGELGAEHGLRIDTSCTTDTARVLRPLGTLHPNGTRVTTMHASAKVYGAAEVRELLGVSEAAPQRVFDMSVNAALGPVEGPPKSVHKIIAKCPAMAEVAAARGDVPEPFWRAMLGVVKFTVEGLDAAHELSCGHPDYDPDETERKFHAWAAGPTSCAEFARQTSACATCPHNGKIKSPVNLGFMSVPEVEELPPELKPAEPEPAPPSGAPWDGCLPARARVVVVDGAQTLVQMVKVERENDSGEVIRTEVPVPITRTVFWLDSWSDAEHAEDTAQTTLSKIAHNGAVLSYPMEQALIADRSALVKHLASKAIRLVDSQPRTLKAVEDYIRQSLEHIEALANRPKIRERFGPRILRNGKLVVAHGRYVINGDGSIEEASLSKALVDSAKGFRLPIPNNEKGRWGPEVWDERIIPAARRHVEFFRRHYGHEGCEAYQLAIMLGLASPLMPFVTGSYHGGDDLPSNGLSVSLYSLESGRGKTALVQALMLAFGDPNALVADSNDTGSTDLARISKLSLWGTMPMVMEEMGSTRERSIANLISAVANGAARERATKDGGLMTAPRWALINLITTNRAQRDMVASTQEESAAIQYRLLELDVDGVTFNQPTRDEYTRDLAGVLRDCAGALGGVVHRLMAEMGPEELNSGVMRCVSVADRMLKSNQDARFQYRALGAAIFLHQLLNKHGLAPFNLKTLVDAFKAAHDSGVVYVQENIMPTDGLSLMSMMLSELRPHTIVTEHETSRGVEPGKYDLALNERMPTEVYVRHIKSEGISRVSAQALRDWTRAKKVSERNLIEECKAAGVLLPPSLHTPGNFTMAYDLFKGMREENAARSRCFKVDTRRLAALVKEREGGVEEESGDGVVVPMRRREEGAAAAAQREEESA